MLKNKINPVAFSRRRFLHLAGVGGLAAAISACSTDEAEVVEPTDVPVVVPTAAPLPTRASEPAAQDTSSAQATPNATREKPAYDANLANVWIAIAEDPSFCDRFDTMAEGFASENPGVRINAVQCAWGGQNFAPVLKSRLTQAQSPDAIVALDGWLPDLIAANLLEPLDELMGTSAYSNVNNWPSNLLNAATYQGKTYGLPLFVAPDALYYNAGAFEKKGISAKREDFPKTWDELKRISKEFTTWSGDSLQSAGFIPSLNGGDLPLWFALNGGGMFDAANNKYVIDQERNIEIVAFVLGWLREEFRGDIVKIRNTGDFQTQNTFADIPAAFKRGALALTRGSILASDALASQASQPLSEDAKNWNVAPYPIGPSGTETATPASTIWGVQPINAKHRDDAFKYLDFVGGKGVADALNFDFGTSVPGNKAIAEPQGSKAVEQARGEAFAKDWLAFFLKQRDAVKFFDTSPITGFASDVLGLQMEDVVRGKLAPDEALRQAQKLCQDRLEQVTKK